MIGIWTNRIGLDLTYSFIFLSNNDLRILHRFHNAWEFWAYSIVYGLVVGPNYSISQTMMGELTPPGFEYMVGVACSTSLSAICSQKRQFFGLFGLSNRSASIIGPNVIQAIVDKNENNWKAFPVLFVFSGLACLVVWFGVNIPKGRAAAAQWAAEKREMIICTAEKDSESCESKSEDRFEGKI